MHLLLTKMGRDSALLDIKNLKLIKINMVTQAPHFNNTVFSTMFYRVIISLRLLWAIER